ncbi:MAG: NAD(+)/NADH kinase [Ignavibacteriales bacterium]|nr:NAD(+)/NADH kinase [Ignavibacteriales bacterium]
MTIGIIPNTSKSDILGIVKKIIVQLQQNGFDFILSDSILKYKNEFDNAAKFLSYTDLSKNCDMLVSIGGDGTMLNTAFEVRNSSTPIIGVNFGKLGFLAEFDLTSFSELLHDIKTKNYTIEERMALIAKSSGSVNDELYAINDIVIDKGPWPKMIELTIKVDDDYVSTFSADGLIIATPTGSTGYSLSTGGPIVNPKADVITLSPIAPHTLTMRPLVISSGQKITVMVNSPSEKIQVSCDGQRVNFFNSPAQLTIEKNKQPVRLIHSNRTNYFEILRNKLYWGLDVRKSNNSK